MPQILLLLLIAAALRGLVKQTKQDLAKWRGRPMRPAGTGWLARWVRRHVTAGNAGYWGHQAGHLFPTVRHGLHDGWTRGREAHHKAQRAIAQNRTEFVEGTAARLQELGELRRRRAEAKAAAERYRRSVEYERTWDEALEEKRGREPHPACVTCGRCLACEPHPPHVTVSGSGPEVLEMPFKGFKERVCVACGGPAGPKFGALVAYTTGDPDDDARPRFIHQAHKPALAQQTSTTPGPDQVPGGQGNGDRAMGEVTYAGVKQQMQQNIANAEQKEADAAATVNGTEEHTEEAQQARRRAQTAAEGMQVLKVDAAVLDAMATYLDETLAVIRAAQELEDQARELKKRWASAREAASNVRSQLDASGHGGVQEARDNAAGGGADREFYEEGASRL